MIVPANLGTQPLNSSFVHILRHNGLIYTLHGRVLQDTRSHRSPAHYPQDAGNLMLVALSDVIGLGNRARKGPKKQK